jgi:3-dehydroquinate synthetase
MPKTDDIDLNQLIENFAFDKKMVGNSLKWILLNGIGKPVIIENKEIPTNILFESIQIVLNKSN